MQVNVKSMAASLATVIVAGASIFAATGCGSSSSSNTTTTSTSGAASATAKPGSGKPAFVLGDKNFAEEYILGALYQQALQAQGYTVTLKGNIGSTEVTWAALKSGQIDGYPEYDGTLLSTVAGITANPASAAAAQSETQAWAAKNGYVFTTTTPFTDADAIGTLKSYAQTNGLTSLADLKKLGSKFKLAGAPEFQTRYPDGLVGLQRVYGASPTFSPTNIGSFYSLLDNGSTDGAVVFTTDPQLKSGKYTVLSDPKSIFGFQNVGLVIKSSVANAEGPAFLQTINKVSALLTQPAIIALHAAVELDGESPTSVAHTFLVANHLV